MQFFKKIYALQACGNYSHPVKKSFRRVGNVSKRASFWLSVRVRASVTVEASIAIPIFIFSFVEILSLLSFLSVYGDMLCAVKEVGEPVSIYGYAYDLLNGEREVSLGETALSSVVFSKLYLEKQIQTRFQTNTSGQLIEGGAEGISLLGSYVSRDNNCIRILATYNLQPAISFAGTKVKLQTDYYARLWTGYSLEKETGAEYVYITDNASVYHTTRDCTHLRLSIKTVTAEELTEERNDSGGRYTRCPWCLSQTQMAGSYYITKSGDRYHGKLSCSGLKRTTYKVTKEEVSYLPMCKRCEQKEEP